MDFPYLYLPLIWGDGSTSSGSTPGPCTCDPVTVEVLAGVIGNPARLRFWYDTPFTITLTLVPSQDISTWDIVFLVQTQSGLTTLQSIVPDEVDFSTGVTSVSFDAGSLPVGTYRFQYRKTDDPKSVLRWGFIRIEQ